METQKTAIPVTFPPGGMDLSNPNLLRVYTNYIIGGHSSSDLFFITALNGHPQMILNMPPVIAKQLYKLLGGLLEDYEKQMGTINTEINEQDQ